MQTLFSDDERFGAPDYDWYGHASESDWWFRPTDEQIGDFGPGFRETYGEWRLRQWRDADSHVKAWKESPAYQTRPFRFEDLGGRGEPAKWGPTYPQTASAAVEKWRAIGRVRELTPDEKREHGRAVGKWIRSLNAPKRAPCTLSTRTNAPSGQAGPFNSAKHQAKLIAELHAACGRESRAWASGAKSYRLGCTIVEAYERAMDEKRARAAAAVETLEAA